MLKGDIESGSVRRQVTSAFIGLENFSAIASEAALPELAQARAHLVMS